MRAHSVADLDSGQQSAINLIFENDLIEHIGQDTTPVGPVNRWTNNGMVYEEWEVGE